MKAGQLQQLINGRDYIAIQALSRRTNDNCVAAKLRLICAAIDASAVFGPGPHAGAPQGANDFARGARELLSTPDLAIWALEPYTPNTEK